MASTDYKIEALAILLDENCLLQRYYPLVTFRDTLVTNLSKLGCKVKSDIQKFSDDSLLAAGLENMDNVRLFRRFLTIYDPKPSKKIQNQLFLLPGVKEIRASIYEKAGFSSLEDIASTTLEEFKMRTRTAIEENNLDCIVPLDKEIRTHIAVARAFTLK